MANEEQLQRLRDSIAENNGCAAWNQWRHEDRDKAIDLSGVNLAKANLSGASLSGANLSGTRLVGADLSQTYLSGANLSGTELVEADLSQADLNGADLSGAILIRADLSETDLSRANLNGTDLSGADLSGADLSEADLSEASFSGATLIGINDLGGYALWLETRQSDKIILWEVDFIEPSPNESDLTEADTKADPAEINKVAHAVFSAYRKTARRKTKLYSRAHGGVRLYEAKTEQTNLSRIDWEMLPRLGDEFSGSSIDWFVLSHFLGWSERYENHQTAARAYQRLAKNLRDQNLNDDADRYAYRAQICRRRMLFRKILAWPSKLPQYLLSHLMNLIAGYGYKPERTLFWYLATIASFTFMYMQVSQGWMPFGLTTPTSLPHLPWYEALILSVSSFHGRGFFQPVQSLGDPVAALAAIEAVIGLFIEVSFIATFTQRFFGK